MNQANFDVSHELDEFLMVEKPLTHSKRKANPDLEKMKPELRQLEEQYVSDTASLDLLMDLCPTRFTLYNFSTMKRMSYYPHNQPIAAVGTDSDGTERTLAQSVTGTMVPTASIVDRSQAGSPIMDSVDARNMPPIPYGSQSHTVS